MPKKLEKKIKSEDKKLAEQRHVYLEDMFNDIYSNRKRIYKLNFFRGVFFGFGTFLGGTVVIAVLIWVLSQFIDWPWVAKLLQTLQQ